MTGLHLDGRTLRGHVALTADVIVVGSGPAGAAVARELARGGVDVLIVEAGRWFTPEEFPESAFAAMSTLYRSMSASVTIGTSPMPYIQAQMVGGSSPINGAICWRLPHDVHAEWLAHDPALAETLPWAEIETHTDQIETRLNVTPTDPRIAGRKSTLMALGADALGLSHRPIRRNVMGCEGLGRCLQGCPNGRKLSVDRTLLLDAMADGTRVVSSVEVEQIVTRRQIARGVLGRSSSGAHVKIHAKTGVVLAASAIQTPALLLRSGIDHGPVGRHFQCHPGLSVAGHFPDPVHNWRGATQGHEVTGLRADGLKFETLGFGMGILAARLDGMGQALAQGIDQMAHVMDWGVAVRAEAEGRVRVFRGQPVLSYTPSKADIARFRRGIRVLGHMLLAAGATHVSLGVQGLPPTTHSVNDLIELERHGPTQASAYTSAITHMFGTCRMGSDPATSVVRPDFRHHGIDKLWVADSSVFPSNIGVNPQIPIMAVAARCGQMIQATAGQTPLRPTRPRLTLDDLMKMDADSLFQIMQTGGPLDPDILAGRQYLGVDLSLPDIARKLLWQTFRKTFVRAKNGDVRGWNVRMAQHGIDGAREPLRKRDGRPITFGHYRVRSAVGHTFPRGWRGTHFLDYGAAGNSRLDPARLGYAPLVAVNPGNQDLLLGWEVFKLGPTKTPFPFFWALRYEGPVDEIVEPINPI